jgi:hypothetical protein
MTTTSSDSVQRLLNTRTAEDPHREPHEKETAFHLEGDGTHFSVTSFKQVVFTKLLRRPAFTVTRLHVLDDDGREDIVDSLDEAATTSSLTVIGVVGRLPVGAVNIGTPRNSNSHADLVK